MAGAIRGMPGAPWRYNCALFRRKMFTFSVKFQCALGRLQKNMSDSEKK